MKLTQMGAALVFAAVGLGQCTQAHADESHAIRVIFRAVALPEYLRGNPEIMFKHVLGEEFRCSSSTDGGMTCLPKSTQSNIHQLETSVRMSDRTNHWEQAKLVISLVDETALTFDEIVYGYLRDWTQMSDDDTPVKRTPTQARCGHKVYQYIPTAPFNIVVDVFGKRSPPAGCTQVLRKVEISFTQGFTMSP